jgi:hypothetical protein
MLGRHGQFSPAETHCTGYACWMRKVKGGSVHAKRLLLRELSTLFLMEQTDWMVRTSLPAERSAHTR